MKRVWYVSGLFVLSAGVIALGYYFRPQNKASQTYLDNTLSVSNTGGNDAQNTVGPQGLSPVFKESVLNFFPYEGGVLGVASDGKILNTNGEIETILSSTSVPFSFSASASRDRSFVLIAWGGAGSPQFRIWSAKKGTWRFLPVGATSPTFSPQTHEVAYIENSPGGSRFSILNLDSAASRGKIITTLPLEDINISWISTGQIAVSEKGSLPSLSSELIYDLNQKTVSPVVVEKNGLDISWSPSGKMALVLLGKARGGSMALINNSGEILQNLSLLTLPEKCSWSGDQKLFCAIPQNPNVLKTDLPDSFYKRSFFADDNFYEINAQNGDVAPILENSAGLDAASLKVFGGKVWFINRLDGKLYSLPIPV